MTQLNSITLQSPGTLGLNTQAKDDVIDPRYATILSNLMFDRSGRISARYGWTRINSSAATGTPDIDVIHSYITSTGTEIVVSTGGNKLWNGTTTLTDCTGSVSVTGDLWQFANFNGNVVGVQASHEPIWWDGTGNFEYLIDQLTAWAAGTAYALDVVRRPLAARNGYYYEVTTAGTSGGAEPVWGTTVGGTTVDNTVTWTCRQYPKGNAILAAWGRVWTVNSDANTIYYSDLLIPSTVDTGSGGNINLKSVWAGGSDSIVALAAHNNNLIIFCKRSIVIYGSADDIANIALVDIIKDIGCVARDSVQNIGTDIVFLSSGGLRSLGRTVIQDKMPANEISYNIREDLASALESETVGLIRSTYNERHGFYLLNMPSTQQIFYFDVTQLSQGAIRPSIWTLSANTVHTRLNNDLIFGMDGGFLGIWNGYLDYLSTYNIEYQSGWMDVGLKTTKGIWKEAVCYFGSEIDVNTTFSWAFDFVDGGRTLSKVATGGEVSEWGLFEWGLGEWGSVISGQKIKFPMGGTGAIIKVGLTAQINNGNISFNKIDLYFKGGKSKE